MTNTQPPLPARLQEIVDDFEWAEGRDKLELLIQYSEQLPPLPAWLQEQANGMEQVHECMSPVFVAAQAQDGKFTFHLDVPKSSPTVRGFASILAQGLQGTSAEEVLSLPGDFYQAMGLEQVLTHQRLNGIAAILAHLKALVVKEMNAI